MFALPATVEEAVNEYAQYGQLTALTAVHNYFIKRPDGTTAAERFFKARPGDLFSFLLTRVDLPGRSAQKRAGA